MPFARRLKHFRTRKGLTLSQVARLVGVSESTYRDWENGRQIKGEPYPRLATAFEVSLSELFLGDEAAPQAIVDDLRRAEEILRGIRLRL